MHEDFDGHEQPQPDVQILFKINNKMDDSLESTRRMRRLVEESRDAGAAALSSLDRQGQQLDGIEQDLEHMGLNLKDSEKIVKELEKSCWYDICCCFCCCCRKQEEEEGQKVAWKKDRDSVIVTTSESSLNRSWNASGFSLSSSFTGRYIGRITNDSREDEMDQNLQGVDSLIGTLRNMALDQGSTIEKHNKQITRINAVTENRDTDVRGLNKRMEKLL